MEDAFSFCSARVREADKDRFLATLFAAERHRGPLFALYAFDLELAQVRDRITQPLPGEVRLQWWRDVVTEGGAGEAGANPIAAGLVQTMHRFALPVPALLDLIDAHTFDLYDEPMATVAALEDYGGATAGAVIALAARILNDGIEPGENEATRHAGIACTVARVVGHLPRDSARGQRFLPDDTMARHGASAGDVLAGRATHELRAVLAELRQLARRHLAALKTGEAVPLRLLPAFLPASLVAGTLQRAEQGDPFRPRVVPQWRRQWTLWRTARDPARFISVAAAE